MALREVHCHVNVLLVEGDKEATVALREVHCHVNVQCSQGRVIIASYDPVVFSHC